MLRALPVEERRMYERKDCSLQADLDDYENTYSGCIRNLCKGGAYIEAEMGKKPEIGQEIFMTIPYKRSAKYLIIKALVAWTREDGIGVTFIKNPGHLASV